MPTPFRQLESVTSYTADGATTAWNFSFASGYLDKSHVKAYQLSPLGARTEIPVTVGMFAGPNQLTISPPVANGYELTIYRDTPTASPIVDFTDKAAFTETDLDTVVKQSVFSAAETQDALSIASERIDQIGAFAQSASDNAGLALTYKGAAEAARDTTLGYRDAAMTARDDAVAAAATLNDGLLVHKAGAETITGVKTFSAQPVGITKGSVGLGNVDNTSDVNKPVSTATQTAMNGMNGPRVMGLLGINNATTPLTKYDLSADAVTMRNSAGATVTRYAVAATTCDLGLAGPAANGRDQAAALTANSWVYLYLIWNGATVATLASPLAPTAFTGATLPAGYTHWAFATALRWNGSSNIVNCRTHGARVFYDMDNATVRALSAGGATAFTAVSCTTLIPPCSQRGIFSFVLSLVGPTSGGYTCNVRPTGSAKTAQAVVSAYVPSSGGLGESINIMEFPTNAAQSFDYRLTVAPSSGGLYVDTYGYVLPNGGE